MKIHKQIVGYLYLLKKHAWCERFRRNSLSYRQCALTQRAAYHLQRSLFTLSGWLLLTHPCMPDRPYQQRKLGRSNTFNKTTAPCMLLGDGGALKVNLILWANPYFKCTFLLKRLPSLFALDFPESWSLLSFFIFSSLFPA